MNPLPDIHALDETRGVALARVGVRGVSAWLAVTDPARTFGPLPVLVDLGVSLGARQRAAHLSRLGEAITAMNGQLSVAAMPRWVHTVAERMESSSVHARFAFPLLVPREAPVSHASGLLRVEAEVGALLENGETGLWQTVSLPVQTLCPCSKAMSDRGAHNQRCQVTLRLRSQAGVGYEDLLRRVEASGSCEVYPVLKRADERFVTERAYARPAFVEDVARDLLAEVRQLAGVLEQRIEVVSQESIHPHDAFALVETG